MKVIIGAQKEEIESIKDLFTDIEEKEYLTIKYLQGKIHNQDCVLAQGGIGAAATVMLITLLKTKFDIEYIKSNENKTLLDGVEVANSIIPVCEAGTTHKVTVYYKN